MQNKELGKKLVSMFEDRFKKESFEYFSHQFKSS
jgi:hypothetical protein